MNTVLDKIRKLLRLARSANPHEAELAMQRAVALAAAHRIEIDGLDLRDDANRTSHRETGVMSRMPYDRKYAGLICQRFFRIKAITRGVIQRRQFGPPVKGEQFIFVGTDSDLEIASYVYQFLYRHFALCWRRHRGRCRNRYAFVTGIYEGLYSKLCEAEPPAPQRKVRGNELALSVDAYVAQHFGATESKDMPDAKANAARWRGYVQGRKTNIAPAVKAASSEPLALK